MRVNKLRMAAIRLLANISNWCDEHRQRLINAKDKVQREYYTQIDKNRRGG